MSVHTVDGRKKSCTSPGCTKQTLKNGINYQPRLVSRISSINCIYQYEYTYIYIGYGPLQATVTNKGL